MIIFQMIGEVVIFLMPLILIGPLVVATAYLFLLWLRKMGFQRTEFPNEKRRKKHVVDRLLD